MRPSQQNTLDTRAVNGERRVSGRPPRLTNTNRGAIARTLLYTNALRTRARHTALNCTYCLYTLNSSVLFCTKARRRDNARQVNTQQNRLHRQRLGSRRGGAHAANEPRTLRVNYTLGVRVRREQNVLHVACGQSDTRIGLNWEGTRLEDTTLHSQHSTSLRRTARALLLAVRPMRLTRLECASLRVEAK